MTQTFSRFITVDTIGVAAFNAGMNALYTWWLWRSQPALRLFGAEGIGFDLASTPVWIAILSTLLGTAAIRHKLWTGRVSIPATPLPVALHMLPYAIVPRALILGGLSALALAIPLWLMLQFGAGNPLTLAQAVSLKVIITIAMSLLLVPVTIFAACADMKPRLAARPAT